MVQVTNERALAVDAPVQTLRYDTCLGNMGCAGNTASKHASARHPCIIVRHVMGCDDSDQEIMQRLFGQEHTSTFRRHMMHALTSAIVDHPVCQVAI